MPDKPAQKNTQPTPSESGGGQETPAKPAGTSAIGEKQLEHLTREIVHELITKRVKKFIDCDMVQDLITKRTAQLPDRGAIQKLITARIEPLMERTTVHRLLGERFAQTVNSETVNSMISARMPSKESQRPTSWEDDISVNTLDEEPFKTLGPPSSREPELFVQSAAEHGDRETLTKVDIARMVSKDDIPIPIPTDRERYFPGHDEKYWLFGLADYLKVMQSAAKYGLQPKSVLDFGCASGRVLRHFAAQTDIQKIWGSDINRRHIRWLYEHMPMTVRPVFNHCMPSLPIPDASIDVITAFSVFTHIDTFEIHWLAELARILSDDGICYFTVHNEDTWESLAEDANNPDNRLIKSLIRIDPQVADQLKQKMPGSRLVYRFAEQGPYRAQVFLSNKHLETVWGRFFSIQEIIPRHHQRQTVVVLKKRR